MGYAGHDHERRKKAAARGRPSVVGFKRGGKWKWKVFTHGFAPELTRWDDAMMVANELAARPRD